MLVSFTKKSGILQEFHCYTLVGMQKDNMVEIYDPYGNYIYLTKSEFYESLEMLDISYFNDQIFGMPGIKSSAEFNETWLKINPPELIRFVEYDLAVEEDDTDLLINVSAKHDLRLFPSNFITTESENGKESHRVVSASIIRNLHPEKGYFYFTNSVRASLRSGRYKIVVTLSRGLRLRSCLGCKKYLKNGGKEFLFRLAASKPALVEKCLEKETEIVEQTLADWETNSIKPKFRINND